MFKRVFDTVLYFCISFDCCCIEEALSLWLVFDFERFTFTTVLASGSPIQSMN